MSWDEANNEDDNHKITSKQIKLIKASEIEI